MEYLENLCVSSVEPIVTLSCNLSLVDTIQQTNVVSQKMDLPLAQIIAATEYEHKKTRFMLTGHKDWLGPFVKKLQSQGFEAVGASQYGIFVSGFGLSSSAFEHVFFEKLSKTEIQVSKYIRDAKGLLLICEEPHKQNLIDFVNSVI